MRPAEVLDRQADFLSRMADVRFTTVIRESFTADYDAAVATGARLPESVIRQARQNARLLQEAHYNHVRSAEAYHVTADMVDLLTHVAEQADTTDTWQHRLAPSPAGMVRFEAPLLADVGHGRTMKAHWLVWGPSSVQRRDGTVRSVTLLTWYNDSADPDGIEEPTGDLLQAIGRWRWIGAEYLEDGLPLTSHRTPVPAAVQDEVTREGDTPAAETTYLPKYAYALWLLLGQTISDVSTAVPDRAGRRRAERMRLPPRVTVIGLRRRATQPREGETEVEWQHQWIVRQHLRWQPRGSRACPGHEAHAYGPVEAEPGLLVKRCTRDACEAYLARITIDPYRKGPEGAPLVQSAKVYHLRR